ncbi:hypothetical protein BD626DRAFT_250328 [Schizophyllum amplum]|uniref:Uncharacterized protein n=1 Tax=Schizophyllum amplum TaxID=97359 RepID=A0A550CHL7_9AGAR|nr:hypothetical protein BD626DRAFT_250328 [Auriculariopsis ampla]
MLIDQQQLGRRFVSMLYFAVWRHIRTAGTKTEGKTPSLLARTSRMPSLHRYELVAAYVRDSRGEKQQKLGDLGRQIRRPPIRRMMADTRGADPSQRHHGLSAETLRRLSTKTPERRQNLPTVQSALICIIGRPINVYKYLLLVVVLTLSTAESTRVDGVSAESLCEESARTLRGGSSQRPPMAETIY